MCHPVPVFFDLPLAAFVPAKINLTQRPSGRRGPGSRPGGRRDPGTQGGPEGEGREGKGGGGRAEGEGAGEVDDVVFLARR